MYKWNNKVAEGAYKRANDRAVKDGFTEEELSTNCLEGYKFNTKSPRIWRMIHLAYTLGRLSGIKLVDELETPVSQSWLRGIGDIEKVDKEVKEVAVEKKNFVLKDIDTNCYYTGYSKFDTQLRKAKIYTSLRYITETMTDARFMHRKLNIVEVKIQEI